MAETFEADRQRTQKTTVPVHSRSKKESIRSITNYGVASVRYVAKEPNVQLWFGVDRLRFRPPHDRRHQLNIVGNTQIRDFDISIRWNFGSGRPYTRVYGFDGFVLLDGVQNLFSAEDDQRVIYGRPFGGILPTYHRMDVSVERRVEFDRVALATQLGAINPYGRRNLFALVLFTTERNYQLPIVPNIGLRIEVN